jgi:uncharacterized protein
MPRSIFYIGVFLVGIFILFYIADYSISHNATPSLQQYLASTTPTETNTATTSSISTIPLITPKDTLRVIVAKGKDSQEKGLGGRSALDLREGMIFPFDTAGQYGFWMKDMLIPIDIIWLDGDKKVIGMNINVATSTYPTVFYPPSPVSYVLEINAGKSKLFGIATGTQLSF